MALDSLLRKFNKLSDMAQGDVMIRAAFSGMLVIVNQAKRNAPVVTGTLRRSLHVGDAPNLTPDFNSSEDYRDVRGSEITDHTATVYGGTDLEYAAAVEFGTESRTANPYLRNAFDTHKAAATAEVQAAFRQLIAKAIV